MNNEDEEFIEALRLTIELAREQGYTPTLIAMSMDVWRACGMPAQLHGLECYADERLSDGQAAVLSPAASQTLH